MSESTRREEMQNAAIMGVESVAYDRRTGKRFSLDGEQLDAVRAREPVVALSAGAGSGKTTVLVERFLDIVTSNGVSPLSILAITYTERAAAEMKERIIRRFDERGDEVNRRRAEAAYISTIHGFCARLLRENPLAAGVDPSFQIVDGMRLGFFLDEERERMLEDEWYLDVRALFSDSTRSSRDRLFELIRDCVFQSREFGKGVPAEESFDIDEHVAVAMHRVDEYRSAEWNSARASLLGVSDEIAALAVSGPARMKKHEHMCELLDQLEALPTLPTMDTQWIEEFCDATSFTGGVKDTDARASVKRVLDPVRKALKALAAIDCTTEAETERDVIAPIKVGIYRHACELRERYERMKTQHSLLDFEDLQRLTLALLRRDEICTEYAARFTHILLDEAQDTNEVQESIVNTLLCDRDQCFFAVGDVKQSIYGFRGADVRIFRDIHRGAGTGRLELRDNYRSRSEILDFVNAVGERLWDDGASVEYQPLMPRSSYQPMSNHTQNIELMLVEKCDALPETGAGTREDASAGHEREALALARRIQCMVEGVDGSPPLRVRDRDTREYRDARYGDIAILTSRRTHFAVYERVLANLGIPAIADGGRGFFSGVEVQDILSALRVIANPFDEPALLAALRSPLFGWSDDDLVRLRLTAPRDLWRALRDGFAPAGGQADVGAYDTLVALRSAEQLLSPVRLINVLLHRTGYAAALLRTAHGRTAIANVNKLLEFARLSEDIDGPDLRRFIHRAELARDYLAQEQEAVIAVEGEDVVLLGTIHGSKGLEWPIVILADLESNFARSNGGSCYSATDEALILNPKGSDGELIKPASQQLLLQHRAERAEQEARRLFYVGMTRAREYLVLSGRIDLPDKSSAPGRFDRPIDWLAETLSLTAADTSDSVMTLGDARLQVTHVTEESVMSLRGMTAIQDQTLVAARRAVSHNEPVRWNPPPAERLALIAATVRDVLVSPVVPAAPPSAVAMNTVTQLVYFKRCPMVYYFNLVLQIDEHRARRKGDSITERRYSALELGTVVHGMLERADLTAPPVQEAQRLVRTAGPTLPQRECARIEQMLTTVLSDPIMDRARRATMLEREYPFHMDIGGTTVHGVIDLVFADEHGRGVVVDYKSNDLTAPGRIDVLARQYQLQIELYALAASKAGLVAPQEAVLYFLNRGEPRTFEMGGERLHAVEGDAGETLARISRGVWETEPGEKCRNCGYRKRGFCDVGKRFVE